MWIRPPTGGAEENLADKYHPGFAYATPTGREILETALVLTEFGRAVAYQFWVRDVAGWHLALA